MSYVPGYKNDIFVSYAAVDNESLLDVDIGWVTKLIADIKRLLNKKLGSKDACTLWLDEMLQGNISASSQKAEQLQNSATLLLIWSANYQQDPECRAELHTFLGQEGKDSGRIFVVRCDSAEFPTELDGLPGYLFYEVHDLTNRERLLGFPKSTDQEEYYDRILSLSEDLSGKLKDLKKKGVNEFSLTEIIAAEKTVFLAEVTDDLTAYREQVQHELESYGLRVLPKAGKSYCFATTEAWQQAIDADLNQSAGFVQLLSTSPPKSTAGRSTPQLQYERAVILNKPIYQWRSTAVKLEMVTDVELRTLLNGSTVTASGIAEFKQDIVQRFKPKLKSSDSNCALILVSAEKQETTLAYQMVTMLKSQRLNYNLLAKIDKTTILQTISANLEKSHPNNGVIILIPNSSPTS